MKLRALAVPTAALFAVALATPAFAAQGANFSMVTSDGSLKLNGGEQVVCLFTDSTSVMAEFALNETIVSINVRDNAGGVAVTGDKTFEGTATEVKVNSESRTFSVNGTNEAGVTFTINAECSAQQR